MASEAELLALAERCEQASGPDRDMDALIAPLQGYRIVDEGHPLGRCCYDANGTLWAVPRYTASLDAAMTLVPKNIVGWRMDWSGTRAIVRMGFGGNPETVEAWCHTPALALCAAALRARAATMGSSDD